MKLQKTYEVFRDGVQQELRVSCEVKSKKRLPDLGYEDFEVHAIYAGVKIEVSHLFGKAGLLIPLIDGIDWEEVYDEQVVTENVNE